MNSMQASRLVFLDANPVKTVGSVLNLKLYINSVRKIPVINIWLQVKRGEKTFDNEISTGSENFSTRVVTLYPGVLGVRKRENKHSINATSEIPCCPTWNAKPNPQPP